MKLFDSTVGSGVLWCTESWRLTQDEKRRLRVAQNTMMRKMVGVRRLDSETWVEWVRRATNIARRWAKVSNVRMWVREHGRKKWEWAGHAMRRGEETWLNKVTVWRDSLWNAAQPKGGSAYTRGGMATYVRPQRRRWLRFEDPLRNYALQQGLGPWQELAEDSVEGRVKCRAEGGKYAAWDDS